MDWAPIRTAIKNWFAGATGLPVVWMNEKRPLTDKPLGVLQITSQTTPGPDDLSLKYDSGKPSGLQIVATVRGMRQFVVSCMVTSRDQTSNYDALYYLNNARTQLNRPSLFAYLQNAGIGILNDGNAIRIVDGIFDNRYESRAVLDILFSAAENVTYNDSADGNTYINTVELSSSIDGVTDPDVQLDDDIIGNI